jgi:hypothetical protein
MGGFDSVFPYEHNPKDCAANKPNENDQLLHNVRLFNTLIINYFFDPNSIDLEDYFDDLMFFITQRGMPFKSGYPVHYTKKHPQIITRFRSKPYEIKKVGEKYFAAVITINFQGDARIWDFVILPNGTIDDFKFTTYKEVFLN